MQKNFKWDSKVEIAQVNAVDTNDVLARQAELKQRFKAVIAEKRIRFILIRCNGYFNK